MSDLRRSSRADRRKRADLNRAEERRRDPAIELKAYSQIQQGELTVFVQDPLTAQNCAAARHALTSHLRRNADAAVVMDLQKCGYIETPGLSLLFELKKELEARGRSFMLQNPSRAVLRMLNITRMARVFPVRMTTTDHELIPTARGSSPEGAPLGFPKGGTPDFVPPEPGGAVSNPSTEPGDEESK